MMNLNQMATELNSVKGQLKVAKAKEKELTDTIKQEIATLGVEQVKTDNFVLTSKQITQTSLDEDILVKCLTELQDSTNDLELKDLLTSCLYVKVCVDEDKVQELIYKGYLDLEVLQPAIVEKSYNRLTIKEVNIFE